MNQKLTLTLTSPHVGSNVKLPISFSYHYYHRKVFRARVEES